MNRDRAEAIAGWWADAFEVDKKRNAFRAALLEIVEAERFDEERDTAVAFYRLEVDYDPCRTLRAALRAAGIECRGFMCSADGLLPMKTRMRISREGDTVEVSQIVRRDGRRVMDDVLIFGTARAVEDDGRPPVEDRL